MRSTFLLLLSLLAVLSMCSSSPPAEVRIRRQAQQQQQGGPVANGDIINSAFQIPIQTLNAVNKLLQATRGRIQAFGAAYQEAQQRHPNHRLNPRPVFERRSDRGPVNSKALYQ